MIGRPYSGTARSERGSELIALDDALKALAKMDPRKARVICRVGGGAPSCYREHELTYPHR